MDKTRKRLAPKVEEVKAQQIEKLEELSDKVVLDNWGPMGEGKSLVRITTSWATSKEAVDYLISIL